MEIPEELTEENAEELMEQYEVVYEAFIDMETAVEDYTSYLGVKEAIEKMHEAEELISKFTEGRSLLADTNFVDIDSFEKLQEFITYVNEADSGTFTANITADFEFASKITLSKNTVQIIGNEHTINMNGYPFNIESSATLILGADDGSDTLNITGNNSRGNFVVYGIMNMYSGVSLTEFSTVTSNLSRGGTICVRGTFNMYGGKIYNCQNSSDGNVFVEGGTFNMGGNASITDNIGRGVFVGSYNTFNMSGNASITNNTSKGNAGGVYITIGTFNMKDDSSIGHNSSDSYGGGVYMVSSTFNMSGSASITNNSASNTGGVYINGGGKFTMDDNTKIAENRDNMSESTTISSAGGVLVGTGTAFNMMGDSCISQNEAGNFGGGVVIYGNMYMRNNAKITNNHAIKGGGVVVANETALLHMSDNSSINNNSVSKYAGGILTNGKIDMSGSASVTNNTSNTHSGGICINGENAALYMSNSAFITNNTANTFGGGVTGSKAKKITLKNVFNNEGKDYGDDYYGNPTNLILNTITINEKLSSCPSDCEEVITGWYLDENNSRWGTYNGNSHSCNKNAYYVEYNPEIHNTTSYIALKCAHAFVPVEASYRVIWKDADDGTELKSEQRTGYISFDVAVEEADKNFDGYIFDVENVGNVLETEVKENGETELILYFKKDIYYNIEIKYDSLEFSYEAKAIKWDAEALEYNVIVEPTASVQKEIIVTNKSNREVELLPSLNKEGTKTGVTYTMSLKRDNETLATITEASEIKEATGKKVLTCNDDGSNKDTLTLKVEKAGFESEVEEFTDFKVATLSLEFTAIE